MKIVRFSSADTEALSLGAVIESVIASHRKDIAAKQLTITSDSDQQSEAVGCPDELRRAVEKYFAMAVERSPCGGEIDITAVVGRQAFEVEIADDGMDVACRISRAFAQTQGNSESGWDERSMNLQVEPKRCPQGGVAWTMRYTHALSARRVA